MSETAEIPAPLESAECERRKPEPFTDRATGLLEATARRVFPMCGGDAA